MQHAGPGENGMNYACIWSGVIVCHVCVLFVWKVDRRENCMLCLCAPHLKWCHCWPCFCTFFGREKTGRESTMWRCPCALSVVPLPEVVSLCDWVHPHCAIVFLYSVSHSVSLFLFYELWLNLLHGGGIWHHIAVIYLSTHFYLSFHFDVTQQHGTRRQGKKPTVSHWGCSLRMLAERTE